MHTQFFGNFLLNEGHLTPEQLIEALEDQKKASRDFETKEQADALLTLQNSDYLQLFQIIEDKGFMTQKKLEEALLEYQAKYELAEFEFEDDPINKLLHVIDIFYNVEDMPHSDLYAPYISLLLHNVIRFVGEDFTPHQAITVTRYQTKQCVTQQIIGGISMVTALDMDDATAFAFASRYTNGEAAENDEETQACIDNFINLHNGIYIVNLSNEFSLELSLLPTVICHDDTLDESKDFLQLPITFPFGTINFLIEKID